MGQLRTPRYVLWWHTSGRFSSGSVFFVFVCLFVWWWLHGEGVNYKLVDVYLWLHWCNFLVTFLLCNALENGDTSDPCSHLYSLVGSCSCCAWRESMQNCTKRWTWEPNLIRYVWYWWCFRSTCSFPPTVWLAKKTTTTNNVPTTSLFKWIHPTPQWLWGENPPLFEIYIYRYIYIHIYAQIYKWLRIQP